MLLLHVFKHGSVPLNMFDSAVGVFYENDGGAGLNQYPFRHALSVDNQVGMLADPFNIMRPLVKRLKARARWRLAHSRSAGGVLFRLFQDVRGNRINCLLPVHPGWCGRPGRRRNKWRGQ